jgi:hypothetical protein
MTGANVLCETPDKSEIGDVDQQGVVTTPDFPTNSLINPPAKARTQREVYLTGKASRLPRERASNTRSSRIRPSTRNAHEGMHLGPNERVI